MYLIDKFSTITAFCKVLNKSGNSVRQIKSLRRQISKLVKLGRDARYEPNKSNFSLYFLSRYVGSTKSNFRVLNYDLLIYYKNSKTLLT